MSELQFHSPSKTVAIAGTERHYMASIINRLFVAILSVYDQRDPILRFWPTNSFVRRSDYSGIGGNERFQYQFTLAASSTLETILNVDGILEKTWNTAANTVVATGNDAMIFCMRLHAGCENHAYVEGPDRAWLATIIENGISQNVLRKNLGYDIYKQEYDWKNVVNFLRERDDEPVVTSHTIGDNFPNYAYAQNWKPDPTDTIENDDDETDEEESEEYDIQDRFNDLTEKEQWQIALPELRQVPYIHWYPDMWQTHRFGNGLDAFMLRDAADRQQPLQTS
jgi:hypothetical protein